MPPAESTSDAPSSMTPPACLTKDDLEQVDAISGCLDRMRSSTAPDPYILTIPQDVEPRYHHSYQYQALQWLDHTPFAYREGEHVQYQTFHFYEPGRDMYVQHSSRSAEHAPQQIGDSRGKVDASTSNAPPKKVMSLGAYSKKKVGGTPGPEEKRIEEAPAKQAAVKGPVERVRAETEEVLAAATEVEHSPLLGERKDLKRKRNETERERGRERGQERGQSKQEAASVNNGPPAVKKVRATSPVANKVDAAAFQEKVKQTQLPPQLTSSSPRSEHAGMPPRLSPLRLPDLPERLSPTLPANIQATLRTHDRHKGGSDASAAEVGSRHGKLAPNKKLDNAARTKSPVPPRNGFRARSSSPAVHSHTEDMSRPMAKSASQKVETPESRQNEGVPASVVKLKIKKHQRQGVQRILSMRPHPDQSSTPQASGFETSSEPGNDRADARSKGRQETSAKVVERKATLASDNGTRQDRQNLMGEKRPPTAETTSLDPPAKRPKPQAERGSAKDEPSTPVRANIHSPPRTLSAQKSSQQLTPSISKHHLSSAMMRDQSSDGNVNTPSGPSVSTPPVNEQNHGSLTNGAARLSSASGRSTSKTVMQLAWEAEQKRLETLGRELKHAASDHLKACARQQRSSDPTTAAIEQKLAAVKSLESLLAYILAFACMDEAAMAAEPRLNPSAKFWRTLHGFYGFVKHNCDAFPAVAGLTCHLGVAFNARILDIGTQYPPGADGGPSRDQLLETHAALRRAAVEAETKLDLDALTEAFPATWARRYKAPLPAPRIEAPGSFAGKFKIPLGVQSTPIAAARAGHAMLQEWVDREGLGYSLQLRLKA